MQPGDVAFAVDARIRICGSMSFRTRRSPSMNCSNGSLSWRTGDGRRYSSLAINAIDLRFREAEVGLYCGPGTVA